MIHGVHVSADHYYVPPVEFVHIVTPGRTFVNDTNTPIMRLKQTVFLCSLNNQLSESKTALHSASTLDKIGTQVALP